MIGSNKKLTNYTILIQNEIERIKANYKIISFNLIRNNIYHMYSRLNKYK